MRVFYFMSGKRGLPSSGSNYKYCENSLDRAQAAPFYINEHETGLTTRCYLYLLREAHMH